MSHDTQALRTLLERLEAHNRGPHPQGSHAVWQTEREVLVARVNAYSALVFADVANELKPRAFGRPIVMCTDCGRPIDECIRDRTGHRYTSSPA